MVRWAFFLTILVSIGVQSGAGQGDLWNPSCDGKQVMVHLFEWTWRDIALECERFLADAGFCAVQISPPMEHMHDPNIEYKFPWWERYQPVSYKLHSRSGTEAELADMISRCNAVGVRIIVDGVVNHMAALDRSGVGIDGSSFDGPSRDFPGVPFFENNFTPRDMCPSGDGYVNDYNDPDNVRNCYLVGLCDLYGSQQYVRDAVAAYFNSLVDYGVAGFRIDAAKHMWPEDLEAMIDLTHNLNTDHGFPNNTKPFFFHEVIDQNDGAIIVDEYYDLGRVTEFRYCQKIYDGIQSFNSLQGVYDPGWGMTDPEHAFIFVDNHDRQRANYGLTITYKTPTDYRLGTAFTLAQPYGFTRVMSSYDFDDDFDMGPPHYSDYSTADVIINDENQCEGGWVCEHRWLSIYKMVRFRNAVAGTDWFNYYSTDTVVAFSRGDLGFFAMAKYGTLSQTFQTGMPAAIYEDIISCKSVTVNADGTALVEITDAVDPVFAICQGCVCDAPATVTATPGPDRTSTTVTTTAGPTVPPITSGVARTVIFVHKETIDGQDLFVRGGINDVVRPGCTQDASTDPCAIDITTNSLGTTTHYDGYNSWRVGDTKLDWFGAETGQGTYLGITADGSPLAWTSSSSSSPGYQDLNIYGDHYWMLDVEMDCSQSEDGWFEVKAYLTNDAVGWESDISQDTSCSGSAGGSVPFASPNHVGKCGFVNVFDFDVGSCTIEQL